MTQTIRPMLAAQKWHRATTEAHLRLDGYLLMQPKIDGFRYLFDDGLARSRSWKVWKHRGVQSFAKEWANLTHGWDCEGTPSHEYDPNGFREAMSSLRAEEGSPIFTLWLFDNYDPTWAHFTYKGRRISNIIDLLGFPPDAEINDLFMNTWDTPEKYFIKISFDGFHVKVKLCPTFVVTSLEEIDNRYAEFLELGWEGAILRRPGRGYKYNRSTMLEGSLVKIKPEEGFEAVITGTYARERNDNEPTTSALGYTTRTAHQGNKQALECLGGFECHLLGQPLTTFRVGVLRGLSMEQKEELWQVRDTLPDRVIECVAHGYSGGYDVPRTPVFLRFRDRTELD